MAKTAAGRFLLCGTNAFKPICREYNVLPRNYTVEKEKPGQAVCPYDPHHNSTAIYVGKLMGEQQGYKVIHSHSFVCFALFLSVLMRALPSLFDRFIEIFPTLMDS